MDKRKNKKEKNEKYIGMCGNTENDQFLFFSSGLNYYFDITIIVYCGKELFYYSVS